MSDRVSLCITSYDRFDSLVACIDSFFTTNTYDPSQIELVIIDNASTDARVKDYLHDLQPPCDDYVLFERDSNDYPMGQKEARVKARELASGDFFIDCPDDHLFVVRSDWLQQCIDHIHRDSDHVGCVVHYAQPMYRFEKKNNEMVSSGWLGFAESLHKGYADYHVMARKTYERIGPFNAKLGRKCESDYMQRAYALGYRRNLLMHPTSIINDDDDSFELAKPITDEMLGRVYESVMRPISNEELTSFCLSVDAIHHKSLISSNDDALKTWLEQ